MAEYQPGVCNIGANERRARRRFGFGSFGVAAAIALAVASGVLPIRTLWATGPFVFGGWVGVLQDYFEFCVGFATLARYDLSDVGGSSGAVTDRTAVRADRKRALSILGIAGILTAPTTALVVGIVLVL